MDDLLPDFVAETRETLDAIAGALIAWEEDPSDRALLDEIFRFVHTVKGSCGFLDLPRLQRLSHAAEDALAEVRRGSRQPDAAFVTAVLEVVDRIGLLTEALASGDALSDIDEGGLIAALARSAPVASAPAQPKVAGVRQAVVRTPARSIRLPVELLDRMMGSVSDMVLARNELAGGLRVTKTGPRTDAAFERLSLCVGELREAVTRARMAKVETLFASLPRMVRDLAAELGKQVVLEIDGGDVELDREMIELVRDSLAHIVRNALDHGFETPAARGAAGKPAAGLLRVAARRSGNRILIQVTDDGRGIDAERVAQRAVAAGLLAADAAATMATKAKLELIFAAGLSTADAVTAISGRGVGMDVVRANIERLGGAATLDSKMGEGTRLSLCVPLTLTIIPALTVSSGGCHFAIPRSVIDEIVRSGGAVRIERIGGGAVATLRGLRLPLIDLGCFMGLAEETDDGAPPLLVIVRTGSGTRYALGVDRVHDHEELVVKPAAPALLASGCYSGTTLPDDSRPMLLLDAGGIAAAAGIATAATPREPPEEALAAPTMQALLFRDLDGVERAMRLSLVERIEDVPVEAVVEAGGGRLLAHGDGLVPLHAVAPIAAAGRLRVLRVTDGMVHAAYAIDRVIDVVGLPADLAAAAVPGLIAGVALYEGRPVELIDGFWLFASVAVASIGKGAARPLCLVADSDDPWAREVLRPLLESAGYRVCLAGEAEAAEAAVIVAADAPQGGMAAPLVRLRTTPERRGANDDSIYRYDRAGLLDALRARVAS